jgi:transcriptional regulator with XRE-family HTH domain
MTNSILYELDEQARLRRLTFGQVVRRHRKAMRVDGRRVSQERLAEQAGCDRQSINRIENGAYSPSLDRMHRLADALGTRLATLLAEADELIDGGSL